MKKRLDADAPLHWLLLIYDLKNAAGFYIKA